MPGFQLNVKCTWTYSQFRLVLGLAAEVTGPFSEIHFFVKNSVGIYLNLLIFSFPLHAVCAVLGLVTQLWLF